jgi:transposase
MRTLTLHFAADALPTLNTFVKQTQEARICRRAQAVRDVVQGPRLHTVSDTRHFTSSARRKWVYRFAHQGTPGLGDRPRPGRPRNVTGALEPSRTRLVAPAPLEPGARSSPWHGRALATALAQPTGVQRGRESVRGVVKQSRSATRVPPGAVILPRRRSPRARSNLPPSSPGLAGVSAVCSMQMQRSSGAVPSPARAGGAPRRALASPRAG